MEVCDLWADRLVPGAYFNLRYEGLSKGKIVQLCSGVIMILKEIVQPKKMKILLLFTHSHVVTNSVTHVLSKKDKKHNKVVCMTTSSIL